MVEFRLRRTGNTYSNWHKMSKPTHKNLDFGQYIYKVNDVVYYHNTKEFREAFNKAVIWGSLDGRI